jgi:hypothetical protein
MTRMRAWVASQIQPPASDVIIRVFDMAEALGLDMESLIEAKSAYNLSRPHRHGGKAL